MAVITISREYGSGGDEVARQVCAMLGYRSFGKQEIIQAAEDTTLSKSNAIDYTEDNHEIQTFLDRLMGRTASPVQKIAWAEDPSIATRPERSDVYDTAVISLVRRAIKAAQRADKFVIVGRGGQVLLQDMPGVLHVRVQAPISERIEHVKEMIKREHTERLTEPELQRMAMDVVVNRDMASADYIKRYYNADWNDPALYHLVLNLGKLTTEQAALIIVTAVHALESSAVVRQ